MKMKPVVIYIIILSVVTIVMIQSGYRSVNNDNDTLQIRIIYSRLNNVDQLFQEDFDSSVAVRRGEDTGKRS